jgi:hypothetical protein
MIPAAARGGTGMEDFTFSDEFCRFIRTTIPSVAAAELLLRLSREPGKHWNPAALVSALRPATIVSEADVERSLQQFQAAGLVEASPGRGIQYRPASESLSAHVHTLEQLYKERPVTLFRAIYAPREPKLHPRAPADSR